MSPFRTFGCLTFVLGALAFLLVSINWTSAARLHAGHGLSRMGIPAAVIAAVGLGTLLHYKIFAGLSILAYAVTGLSVIIVPFFEHAPLWVHVFNLGFGGLILVPSVIMFRCWPRLDAAFYTSGSERSR